jgi:protein-tyrosine-phosphatase
MLAVGATKGANLFEGLNLTAKYFFDAVGADFKGSLTYRRIEEPGDIVKHPTALNEVREKAVELIKPYQRRKKILFACKGNACRSQMSQAFASFHAGDRVEALSAGDSPAEEISNVMAQAMSEKGLDMAFRKPRLIREVIKATLPDIIVTMGCDVSCPVIPGAKVISWSFPDPKRESIDFMRDLRDEIEKKVIDLIKQI